MDVVPDGLRTLAADLSDEVTTVVGDITKEEDIARVVETAGSRVDALANIAGVTDAMEMLHETSDDTWHRGAVVAAPARV